MLLWYVNVWMRQASRNVQTESSCGRRAQCWSRRRRRPRQVVGGSEWSRAEGAPVDAGHRIPLHWQPAGTGLERTRQRKYERSEKGEKVHTRISFCMILFVRWNISKYLLLGHNNGRKTLHIDLHLYLSSKWALQSEMMPVLNDRDLIFPVRPLPTNKKRRFRARWIGIIRETPRV